MTDDELRGLFAELLSAAIRAGRRRGGHGYFASADDACSRTNMKSAPCVPADCAVSVVSDDRGDYPFALEYPFRAGGIEYLAVMLDSLALAVAARIGANCPDGAKSVRVAVRLHRKVIGCRFRFES
jgi:hypothetical protein